MPVKDISIRNFRNHHQSRYELGNGITVFWGENGSGKTSILEAIYILAYGRSFRTNKLLETLQIGGAAMNITGNFVRKKNDYRIELNQLQDGKKRFIMNGQPVRGTRDLIGLNPVVVLSPEEQIITKGAHSNRRAYFDRVFSVVNRDYVNLLIEYTRSLKQRNSALLQLSMGTVPVSAVTAWDEPLVSAGNKIWRLRKKSHTEFVEILQKVVEDFTGKTTKFEIKLFPEAVFSLSEHRAEMEKSLKNDCRRNTTSIGPHRDQYEIRFNGEDLRKFGSQGEHKLSLVLIKMAEALYIRNNTGMAPTILLDDLFAKLDFKRSDQVLSALGKGIQTIITGTDLVDLEKRGIDLSGAEDKSYHLGNN